jgi:hypothetical protein
MVGRAYSIYCCSRITCQAAKAVLWITRISTRPIDQRAERDHLSIKASSSVCSEEPCHIDDIQVLGHHLPMYIVSEGVDHRIQRPCISRDPQERPRSAKGQV